MNKSGREEDNKTGKPKAGKSVSPKFRKMRGQMVGGNTKSTSSITQITLVDTDLNINATENAGETTIYFNVHKIYEQSAVYKFESKMQISIGNTYHLTITQSGEVIYDLTNTPLSVEKLKSVVKTLFDDSLIFLQEHKEHSSTDHNPNRAVLNIVIPDNILSDYFSTLNYQDLLKSCGSIKEK